MAIATTMVYGRMYYDAVCGQRFLSTGPESGEREYSLILNGMLLLAETRMTRPSRFMGIPDDVLTEEETREEQRNPLYGVYPPGHDDEVPDLAFMQSLHSCRIKDVREYIYRYAEAVMPFMEPESAAYVRENLERVVDYLAPKHRDGHLVSYKTWQPEPEKGGSVVFGDFSGDPDKPTLIFLVFGAKMIERVSDTTWELRTVPWKPSLH